MCVCVCVELMQNLESIHEVSICTCIYLLRVNSLCVYVVLYVYVCMCVKLMENRKSFREGSGVLFLYVRICTSMYVCVCVYTCLFKTMSFMCVCIYVSIQNYVVANDTKLYESICEECIHACIRVRMYVCTYVCVKTMNYRKVIYNISIDICVFTCMHAVIQGFENIQKFNFF